MSKQTTTIGLRMTKRQRDQETKRVCMELIQKIDARLDEMGVSHDLNDEKNPRGPLTSLQFMIGFHFDLLGK